MAIRGRKPKPTETRKREGNRSKTPLPADEPQPTLGVDKPPGHITGEALGEWRRMCPELKSLGLLTGIDVGVFAAYCVCYGRWVEAERELASHSTTQVTKNGNLIQNPLLGVANRAMELMCKWAAEFGLTPSSRTRVSATKVKPDDPFEKDYGL